MGSRVFLIARRVSAVPIGLSYAFFSDESTSQDAFPPPPQPPPPKMSSRETYNHRIAGDEFLNIRGQVDTDHAILEIRAFENVCVETRQSNGQWLQRTSGLVQFEMLSKRHHWWQLRADAFVTNKCHWLQFVRAYRVDSDGQRVNESFSASGTFKKYNEWYVDALWSMPSALFYDDGGLHNRFGNELSIFDAPSLSWRESDSDVGFEFISYLVYDSVPVYRIHWKYSSEDGEYPQYRMISGTNCDELDPEFTGATWRLGYSMFEPHVHDGGDEDGGDEGGGDRDWDRGRDDSGSHGQDGDDGGGGSGNDGVVGSSGGVHNDQNRVGGSSVGYFLNPISTFLSRCKLASYFGTTSPTTKKSTESNDADGVLSLPVDVPNLLTKI